MCSVLEPIFAVTLAVVFGLINWHEFKMVSERLRRIESKKKPLMRDQSTETEIQFSTEPAEVV